MQIATSAARPDVSASVVHQDIDLTKLSNGLVNDCKHKQSLRSTPENQAPVGMLGYCFAGRPPGQ